MRKLMSIEYIFMLLLSMLFLCGCQEGIGEDLVVQNPNSGEFGEIGKDIAKQYDYLFEVDHFSENWFVSKLDTCQADSLIDHLNAAFAMLDQHYSAEQNLGTSIFYIAQLEQKNRLSIRSGLLTVDSLVSPEGYSTDAMYAGKVLRMLDFEDVTNFSRVRSHLSEYVTDADLQINGPFWIEFAATADSSLVEFGKVVIWQPIK